MTTATRGVTPAQTLSRAIPPGLLILLGALVALGPLATDAYVPGLPVIAAELQVARSTVQLGVMACLIFLAAGQLVAGPWGDRAGRRIVILTGIAAFSAGAWIAAASWNGPSFIGALALQGAGGAFALVSANAVVRDQTSGTAAAKAFSALLLVTGMAPVLAPILGTLLLATSSWRTIFIVTGAISAVLAPLVAVMIPRKARSEQGDPRSTRAARSPWRGILTDRTFIGLALGNALIFAAMFVYIAGGPFLLQEGYGLDEVQFGIVFAINAVGLTLTAQFSGRLVGRIRPIKLVLVGGIVAVVGGLIMLLGSGLGDGGLVVLLLGLFVLVASIGLVLPYSTATALEAHGEHAGSAMALFGATQYFMGAIGAALAGVLTAKHGAGLSLAILVLSVGGAVTLIVSIVPQLRRPAEHTADTR